MNVATSAEAQATIAFPPYCFGKFGVSDVAPTLKRRVMVLTVNMEGHAMFIPMSITVSATRWSSDPSLLVSGLTLASAGISWLIAKLLAAMFDGQEERGEKEP